MESLKRSFADAVGEFLDSGDVGEAARIIGSLVATGADDSDVSIVCPKQAFKVAMDRGEQALEMAASLLSSLVVRAVMSVGSLCVGLRACVESLEDLKFDNPRAAAHFCGFVAYFLVDGALTDHDVTSLTEGFPALRERIEFAESRPLRRVKEIVRSFVEEYLLAADIGEVDLAVFRLHARHCHHEVVKKIAQSTLAGGAFGTPFARESASQLLASLRRSERISADQFEEGFLRLYRDLPQLCLDEPRAWDTVARFTWRAMSDGVLAPSFASGLAGGAPEHRKFGEALAELRAAAEAAASVSTPHGGGTWGIPAAMTDMATLNAHVRGIVTSFVRSGGEVGPDDVSTALEELHCEMYHHEFVRELMLSTTTSAVDRSSDLLVALHRGNVVSSASLRHGIRRTLRELRALPASSTSNGPALVVVMISALVVSRCVSVAEVGDAFSAADDDETESPLLAEMYERLTLA